MKRLASIFFLFVLFSCDGQKIDTKIDKLAERFVGQYNRKQYDSIHLSFSPAMKALLSLESTKQFFSELQVGAGVIKKYVFTETRESFTRYKAEFTNGIFWLDITGNDDGKIDGLLITPYKEEAPLPPSARNKTALSLPFQGEWTVFWGGDTKEQNYHVVSKAQKNAFDIMITDASGKRFRTDGKMNGDYLAFGQPLLAPCDAEVVMAIEGVKDNIPGEMNPDQLVGNALVLKTANNEFILMAHFKLNSIRVKKGDQVKKGQLLGLCGNSGNSSEPHLHFHLQDQEDMNGATGIKAYFEKILVNSVERTDYSPVRNEKIKNVQ